MALDRVLRVLAAIAAIEGLALLGYAIFDAVEAVRVGITGPSEVSNATALGLQIALFAVFGAAMLWTARGWLRRAGWVRGAFVLAQLIALVVGVPLIGASGSLERVTGIAVTALAGTGLLLVFSPPVVRMFAERDATD